jgi:hypothetical protein
MKNAILTKHLLFSEKKYIELPNIKIKHWLKEDYEKIDIAYLKSRSIVPEAIMNEALMLGYSKNPAKEFKELLMRNQDKDLADWSKVIWQFDITNIYPSSSVFDIRRLLYLNKRNMIKKYIKSHESYKPQIFEEFKQTFQNVYKKHENKIAFWDYETWRKIIYLITVKYLKLFSIQ